MWSGELKFFRQNLTIDKNVFYSLKAVNCSQTTGKSISGSSMHFNIDIFKK